MSTVKKGSGAKLQGNYNEFIKLGHTDNTTV
jgi:hypothetical protein